MDVIVLSILLYSFFTWILLIVAVSLAQKLSDFSMPPWGEAIWKLAVVALGVTVVAFLVSLVEPHFLGWIAGWAALFAFMYKWFDMDPMGAIVLVVCVWAVRWLLIIFILLPLLSSVG